MTTPTKPIPYTISKDSVTIIMNGQPSSIKKGDPMFDKAKAAVEGGDWDTVKRLITKGSYIEQLSRGFFTFKNNHLLFKDQPVPQEIHDHIYGVCSNGGDPAPYMRFWQRLQKNPSWRSVQQLWNFMQKTNEVTVGIDGRIIAYKGVNANYKDAHSGLFDNRPGTMLTMERNKVSDDPSVACHYGFHVGSRSYATSGYAKTMIVAIDPENVVCIPNDSSYQKMRCCSYVVLKEYDGKPLPETIWEDDILGAPIKRKLEDAGAPDQKPEPISVALEVDDLEKMTIKELRTYAGGHGVTGASKIPGGKAALIAAIREVERRSIRAIEAAQKAEEAQKAKAKLEKEKKKNSAQDKKKTPVKTPAPAAVSKTTKLPLDPRELKKLLSSKTLNDLRDLAKTLGVRNIKEPGGKELLIKKVMKAAKYA